MPMEIPRACEEKRKKVRERRGGGMKIKVKGK
jgi:hypothetical protein